MPTSGDKSFTQTRNQIIYDAFQHLGVYGIGRTISSEDMAFAVSTFNKMIKSWSTMGLHLWCKTEAVLYLSQYTRDYRLGNGVGTARSSDIGGTTSTRLEAAAAIGATSLTVNSTTGMTVGDNIGIVVDDKTLLWYTISTIPTSTTLTINSALTIAANNNALVFTYTEKAYKPLRIISARLVGGIDLGSTNTRSEILLNPTAYQTSFEMPSKTSNGRPVQYTYMPSLTDGMLYLWPRPDDCSYRIEYTYERLLDDVNTAADNIDFPSEWEEPATFQLAIRLGPAFGKDMKVLQTLGPMAEGMLDALKSWDSEITTVSIMPDLGEY